MTNDGINPRLTLKENIEVLGMKKRGCDLPFSAFATKKYSKTLSLSRQKDIVMLSPDLDDQEYNQSPLVWEISRQAIKEKGGQA